MENIGLSVMENEETKYYADLLKSAGCNEKKVKVIERKIKSLYEDERKEFAEEILLETDESKLWQRINARRYKEHVIISKEDITEKKKMEKFLKGSEKHLKTSISETPDVIYAFEKSKGAPQFTYLDDNLEEILGYKPEDFIEKKNLWRECVHPEDREKAFESLDTFQMEGSITSKKYRLKDKEGNYRWLLDKRRLIKNTDGSREVVGAWWDITEQKEMEEEIKEKNRLLEGVLNSIPDVIGIQRPDYTMIRYNEAGYEKLDMSPEDIKGQKCYELLGREEICEKCATEKALKTKKLEEVEKYIPELDIYHNCRSNPIINENGEVELVVEQLRDITERKEREKERKRLLEEYETIFNNVQSSIFLLDVEEEDEIKFQRLNPLHEELTGLSTEEIKGKKPVEVLGKEPGKEIEDNYQRCLKKKEKIEYEERLDLPDGERIWKTALFPVIIDGKVEKIVGTSRDITAERMEKLKTDALFENSTSAIARLDKDENIVDINDEFKETFGYSLPEVKGEHLDDVMEWSKEGCSDREETKKILEGEKRQNAGTRYDRHGNPREFLCQGVPIIIEGEIEGAYIIYDDITELQREKEKLEAIFEASQNVSFVITEPADDGEDALIKEFSPGSENIFGYAREEVLNKSVSILHSSEEEEKFDEIHQQLAQGEIWEDKVELIKKDGEKFPALFTAYPFGSRADTNRTLGVSIEITELEESREKLAQIKDEQQLLLDNIDVQVWLLEDERTYRRVNDAFAEFVGMDKEEILNSDVCDVRKVRGSQQNCLQGNKKVFAEREEIKREEKVLNSAGEERVLLITKTPILSDSGEIEYVICTGKDVTELKRTQEKLKIREEQYREIFETAPVGIILHDSEGKMIEVNERICEMSGYSEEELLGNNVFNTMAPEKHEEKYRENICRVMNGEELNYVAMGRRRDGGNFHVQLNETKVSLPGDEDGVLSIQMDITELKEKEEKLKYLSYHDGLTGLYNRSYLEEEMQRLNTERQLPISLIMCDINGMKIVNDTYGHEKGDELLNEVAEILQDVTRDEDIVSRWAGDEFVILLPQTETEVAEQIGTRIEKACEGAKCGDIPITLGIGTATKNSINEKFEDVLSKADEKMYKDKLTKTNSTENRLVQNMLNTLAAKSAETKEHAMRMNRLVHKLGDKAGLTNEQLNRLSLLATLHDIGKTTIPEKILTKPGGLSEKEWQIIMEHSERGHTILTATDDFAHIAKEVLHHHERWDGTGYPEGLEEEEIPLLSRMIAIVDAYDVMTTGRPYKNAMSKDEALNEIKDCAGGQFDPELADQFVKMMESVEENR